MLHGRRRRDVVVEIVRRSSVHRAAAVARSIDQPASWPRPRSSASPWSRGLASVLVASPQPRGLGLASASWPRLGPSSRPRGHDMTDPAGAVKRERPTSRPRRGPSAAHPPSISPPAISLCVCVCVCVRARVCASADGVVDVVI